MARIDKSYNKLCNEILKKGRWYEDPNRKGVNRLQIPHYKFEHDLQKDGFPALTTKKLYWRGVVGELIWFLRGNTNIKYLLDNNIHIWDKDAYNYYKSKGYLDADNLEEYIDNVKNAESWVGDCGRIYGAQWRKWSSKPSVLMSTKKKFGSLEHTYDGLQYNYLDQIANLIKNLKEKPLATDHIVTAWNPAELDEMALPPCHKGFQIMVYPLSISEQKLFKADDSTKGWTVDVDRPIYGFDLVWEQRSVDTFLGLPFNIASYALLAYIIGKAVNMIPGKIIGDLRNVHLYENSLDGVKEQLSRNTDEYWKPIELEFSKDFNYLFDKNYIKGLSDIQRIERLEIDMFKLKDYESYPAIKVDMLERDNN